MGYGFFRNFILSNNETLKAFISGLLTIIKIDRYILRYSNFSDGEPISAHLVISSLSILSSLGLYNPSFAQPLVQSTEIYYGSESERLSRTLQPAEYIAHVKDRLEQEDQRCTRFFERQSKKEVMDVMHIQLIEKIQGDIIERGFNVLVKDNDIKSLETLYHLHKLVDKTPLKSVDILRSAWGKYIKVYPQYFF
jgi:hypothetical protein